MSDTILIVGRGPSSQEFPFSRWDGPIMAVSSGIFVPMPRMPDHFVTLDAPKWFIGSLADSPHAWHKDEICQPWPFWREPGVTKHITHGHMKPGRYRHMPDKLMEFIPEQHRQLCMAAIVGGGHEFGYQPSWGDFPSLRSWSMSKEFPLNFSPNGPLGLDAPDRVSRATNNSLLFAIQIAARLGYKRHLFVGVDMAEQRFEAALGVMRRRQEEAAEHGHEWLRATSCPGLSWLPQVEIDAVLA